MIGECVFGEGAGKWDKVGMASRRIRKNLLSSFSTPESQS